MSTSVDHETFGFDTHPFFTRQLTVGADEHHSEAHLEAAVCNVVFLLAVGKRICRFPEW